MRQLRSDSGATAVEYALMTGLIAAAIAVTVAAFGPAVVALLTPVLAAL
jgi:Flp pilus assembly pilin Flp